MKQCFPILMALSLVACSNVQVPVNPPEQPQSLLNMSGDLGAHDPTLIKAGNTYCSFSTGIGRENTNPGGILVHVSQGGPEGPWVTTGEIPAPEITKAYNTGNVWAPDVIYDAASQKYYLYYAVSRFGTNNSAIGVASSTDPCKTDTWTDLGVVLTSKAGEVDYSAIDPDVFIEGGKWYMSFGSFSSGLKLTELKDPKTPQGEIVTLAKRPRTEFNPVEAPAILKKGEYYYLFMSWDFCCQGLNSTYKIAVGRSKDIKGPYLDQKGLDLKDGGGTIILNTYGNQKAPGGQDVFSEGQNDYLIYHYYDSSYAGNPRMQIRKMDWKNGWPYFEERGTGYDLKAGTVYTIKNQVNNLCLDVKDGKTEPGTDVIQWTCNGKAQQQWKLESIKEGYFRLRSMVGKKDLCLDLEGGNANPGTNIDVWTCNDLFAQNWSVDEMGLGYVRLVGEQTFLAVDSVFAGGNPGTDVRTWVPNNHPAQNWKFEVVK
ncbi:family 43 glycosylhydrolase [Deinococcus cellulosilyticus]|uniref:Ricin B lectin domain-containing protein n=1 Tax=Deinococcus cellulosilyticus (strain DSM 18568 / NBRC 106333 / KACC 11606 / 5516J-15) TaxID=1223518 RepID=A0A511N2N3_DEIC1|nr:family 43 glycosylhydrolase [Deinococcus cellulosilyticus]GEM46777.1 hypothetical protein DC3_24120 [Deinococcus cellulosilyticus NBRC 106333 = KACC 11606]